MTAPPAAATAGAGDADAVDKVDGPRGAWGEIARLGRARWATLGVLACAAACWFTAPVIGAAGQSAFGLAGAFFWLTGLGMTAGCLGVSAALLRDRHSGWIVVPGLLAAATLAAALINGLLLVVVGAAIGARDGGFGAQGASSAAWSLQRFVDGVAAQPGLLITLGLLTVVPAGVTYWFYGGLRGVPAARHAALWTLGALAVLRPLIWIAGVLLLGRREMLAETTLWIAPIETLLHGAGLALVLAQARNARETLHRRG